MKRNPFNFRTVVVSVAISLTASLAFYAVFSIVHGATILQPNLLVIGDTPNFAPFNDSVVFQRGLALNNYGSSQGLVIPAGKVGIGTDNPLEALQVEGAFATQSLCLPSTSGGPVVCKDNWGAVESHTIGYAEGSYYAESYYYNQGYYQGSYSPACDAGGTACGGDQIGFTGDWAACCSGWCEDSLCSAYAEGYYQATYGGYAEGSYYSESGYYAEAGYYTQGYYQSGYYSEAGYGGLN